MKINIMGISELRWPGSRTCERDGGTLYNSGSDLNDNNHRNGVGIFVTADYRKYVANYVPIPDRIILLLINSSPLKFNIKQVYAPTAEKKYDSEVKMFYEQLNDIMNGPQRNQTTFILGDFNDKIGKGKSVEMLFDFRVGSSSFDF